MMNLQFNLQYCYILHNQATDSSSDLQDLNSKHRCLVSHSQACEVTQINNK